MADIDPQQEVPKWRIALAAALPVLVRAGLAGLLTALAAVGLLPDAARDACLAGLLQGLYGL